MKINISDISELIKDFSKEEVMALINAMFKMSLSSGDIKAQEKDFANFIIMQIEVAELKSHKGYDIDADDPETRKAIMKIDVEATIKDPNKRAVVLAVAAGMALADNVVDANEHHYLQHLVEAWQQPLDSDIYAKVQQRLKR